MYEVLLHPDAQEVYVNTDKALAKKTTRCLEQLEQNPRAHPNIKALKGDFFKAQVNTCDSPFPKSQVVTSGSIVLTSTICIQGMAGNCDDATSSFVVISSTARNSIFRNPQKS